MGEAEQQQQPPTLDVLVDDAAITVNVQPPSSCAFQDTIRLDGVSAVDTVLSLRQLIAEYPALACYTCYRFEVQSADGVWLPLNDFVELGEYEAVVDGAVLRMVLENYDARKVRAHVRRFRDSLMNPPIPQTPAADAEEPAEAKDNGSDAAKDADGNELSEKQLERLRKIHENLEGVQIPVPTELGAFYSMQTTPSATSKAKDTNGATKKKNNKKKGAKTPGNNGPKNNDDVADSEDNAALTVETAKLPQCVKSVVFSGYNPPPGPRKLAGDLLYLEVTTEDDVTHFVTAHVSGFYINRSTATKFDPAPRSDIPTQHVLLDVLLLVSPKFKASYTSLLRKAAALAKQGPVSIELMVAAGNQVGGKLPWNTPSSSSTHEYDLNRAEDELCSSFGMDERGMLRDWNEEYQCCRELPTDSLKDQIVRSRVMYKIVNEFVEAATQGAVAIVEGHIPPINPMDDSSAHVFVFNNIFFSLSIDGKATVKDSTGEEAAFSSANRDLLGVKAFNDADIRGLHTLATTVVDYLGVRVIAQSVIPGILQGESASKLVYGSVDGGKTIASNEKMHELMLQAAEKLHLAERSIEPLGTDGDVTGDDDAAPSSEESISAVNSGEAGTAVVKLCGPVEAKGILGADGRMYVLDLVRITPKDATYYATTDESKTLDDGLHFQRPEDGYVALLRPELVKLYALWKQNQERKRQLEEKAKAKSAATKEEASSANESQPGEEATATTNTDSSAEQDNAVEDVVVEQVRLNPNVFMKYSASTDADEVKADEDAARDAADYLQKVVIPAFVTDIRRGAVTPADGHALADVMHSCGINMRYLGRVAALVQKLEAFGGISKYVLELLEVEMIARVIKHVVAALLNKDSSIRAAPGASLVNVLNCVFGGWDEPTPVDESSPSTSKAALSDSNPNKKTPKKKAKKASVASAGTATLDSDETWTAESVWGMVEKQVQQRFGYSLSLWRPFSEPASSSQKFKRVHKTVLLRRVCQRLGLRVVSKNYDFTSTAPFNLDDITGVVPVVKHSLPAHPLTHAKQLLERGRLHLSGGALATAYELLQEASTLMFQVVGGAHEDAALCSTSLATVLYHAGDVAGAIAQQQRALALYTQLQGLDYHDTAFAHANLAMFLHTDAQTDLAVTHLRRAIYLLELCAGPHHPEVSSLYLRMGSMCQDVGQIPLALLCYRESLQRGEFDRLQAANTLHLMAVACSMVGGFRDALAYEKRVFSLLKDAFGEEDPRVVESAKFMARYTERAVEGAKGRREVDAVAAADAIAQELIEEFAFNEDETTSKKKKTKATTTNKKH